MKQLWPRKDQGLARVPKSQQLSARPKGPLTAVEEAHVGWVVCSLSSNLLKVVTGSELFGGSIRRPVMVQS